MRLPLTALVVGIGMWLGVGELGAARADADTDVAIAHLRARGASRIREVGRVFAFAGQSSAYVERLERAGCVAFFALGRGEVRDVDLGLYTEAGQLLVDDVASAPYAYARLCGAAGLTLHVSTSLYAGRGELVLLRVDDAPRELGRLPETVKLAVGVGGSLEDLREVGVAADELTVESSLLQEERMHRALGYVPTATPMALELRAGSAIGELTLAEGRCTRVSASVPHARGIAIEVEAPTAVRWSARSPGEDRVAIALCAPTTGSYAVRIQARPLRGIALVRAFERGDVPVARIRELGEASALAVAEAESVAAVRGLALRQLGSAWVDGETQLAWPIALPAAGCYALAAISEIGSAALDIRLTTDNGVLLAHNEGRRGVPMVFFCAEQARGVRLVLRARGPDLRAGIWLGHAPAGGAS